MHENIYKQILYALRLFRARSHLLPADSAAVLLHDSCHKSSSFELMQKESNAQASHGDGQSCPSARIAMPATTVVCSATHDDKPFQQGGMDTCMPGTVATPASVATVVVPPTLRQRTNTVRQHSTHVLCTYTAVHEKNLSQR
jgi:hypothetical protein